MGRVIMGGGVPVHNLRNRWHRIPHVHCVLHLHLPLQCPAQQTIDWSNSKCKAQETIFIFQM